jgi:hypothetical protein
MYVCMYAIAPGHDHGVGVGHIVADAASYNVLCMCLFAYIQCKYVCMCVCMFVLPTHNQDVATRQVNAAATSYKRPSCVCVCEDTVSMYVCTPVIIIQWCRQTYIHTYIGTHTVLPSDM